MQTPINKKTLRWFRIVFILLPVIAVVDAVIPFLAKRWFNKLLKKATTYKCRVKGVSISFIKRTVLFTGVNLEKVNAETGQQSAFISATDLQFGFSWKALWNGTLILDIEVMQPSVVITHNRLKQLQELKFDLHFPVIIKSIQLVEGTFDYIDATKTPIAAVGAEHIEFTLANPDVMPLWKAQYTVTIAADVCEGKLKGDLTINLDHLRPNFDLNASLRGMNLVCLNNFFLHYASFDVSSGRLDLFVEAEAKTGEFSGYVKPIVRDLDVLGTEDEDRGLVNKLWQGVLGLLAEVVENQKHDQIATKIPFRGTFKNPKVNVAYAVYEVFINAFIRAISPSFDIWTKDIFRKKRA